VGWLRSFEVNESDGIPTPTAFWTSIRMRDLAVGIGNLTITDEMSYRAVASITYCTREYASIFFRAVNEAAASAEGIVGGKLTGDAATRRARCTRRAALRGQSMGVSSDRIAL